MNWSKVLQGLLAVVIAVGGAVKVHAAQIPNSPHKQACEVCHNAFGAAALDFNGRNLRHVCVSCHSDGGGAAHMPFTEESMANPYGTTPDAVPKGQGSWRSHNWDSPLVNPKAGARIPQNSYMTYYDTGKFYFYKDPITGASLNTCTRCHRVHDYEPIAYVQPPDPLNMDKVRLLRDNNDKDQMCNNCHYDWTNMTADQGSHPVKINYTSAWRAPLDASKPSGKKYDTYAEYTTSFYKSPRNHNPTNHTSQLSNYYRDGKINCSTCHSVHYGDSDSKTFDNRSTANGSQTDINSRNFSKSTGMLLRTDQYGTDAEDVNICTNCHKQTQGSRTMTHSNPKRPQHVQCGDCHRSHVTANATDAVINQKLIARTLSYSTSLGNGKGKTVTFTSAQPYYMADPAQTVGAIGVCQSCHSVPGSGVINPRTGIRDYPPDHDVLNTKPFALANDCNGCHFHAEGFTAAGVCESCHGYPPPKIAKQLLNYTTNESLTPHMVHSGGIAKPIADSTKYAYGCGECHFTGSTSIKHKNAVAQDLFVTPGSIGTLYGSPPAYNTANRTCSTVYCHSNGAPGRYVSSSNQWVAPSTNMSWTNMSWKITPSWKNGLGTLAGKCYSCHGDAASLTTGSHAKHVAGVSGYSCQTCHASTVNGTNAIISKTLHANGAKNVGAGFNAVGGTCTNACHTLAVWGGTVECGSCHATSPNLGPFPSTISTGAHTTHLTTADGPQFGTILSSCQVCHSSFVTTGPHVNSVAAYNQAKCDVCHPTANATVTWTNPASVTCRSCHVGTASVVNFSAGRTVNVTAPVKNSFDSAGHGVAFNSIGSVSGASGTVLTGCESCHVATKPHIFTNDSTSRLPGFLKDQNAVCNGCHTQVWSIGGVERTKLVTKTHVTAANYAAGADPSMLCSVCHDSHGTGNKRMIRSSIKFFPTSTAATVAFTNPTSGFVQMVPPYRGLCQVCHTKTGHFKRGVPELSGTHAGADYRKCLTCHEHQPGTDYKMAFAPSNGVCNSCHGFPPVKSMIGLGVHGNYSTARLDSAAGYVGGGGAHAVAGHIGKDLTNNNQTNMNCSNCHSMATHITFGTTTPVKANIHIVVDQKFKFNATQPITYSGSTCSNVSCHYAVTPTW